MLGRVLIIAGSDPSGGAGVQADIKTVTSLGGYAATAITALTVQNTLGVSAVHQVDSEVIAAQIDAVLDDIGVDAVKIGMLGDVGAVALVADKLRAIHETTPIVLDPVLVATSGDRLARDGVAQALCDHLVPLASVVTPNLPEATTLTRDGADAEICGDDEMVVAGEALRDMGADAALVKGGHRAGATVRDVLVSEAGAIWYENPRIDTTSTHGTGCTLASAVATGLAQGCARPDAVSRAIDYVHAAIASAPGFGAGAGPLNHAHGAQAPRR